MTSQYRNIALVFFAAVVARMVFHALTGFTYDDAFITFRYAENIVAGEGFVYNLGQRVLGTTTPLFTLILSILITAGIPTLKAAMSVSLLCSGLTAVLVYRFARSLRFAHFTLLPVVLYILFPRLLPTDTSGMETALFTLLVTASFYYLHKRLPFYAIGAATLAGMTRPEGFLIVGIVLVQSAWRDRRYLIALLGTSAAVVLPWIIFAWLYFGSPVPNSITAKLALYSRFGTMSIWDSFVFLMGWHNPMGLPLVLLAIAGGWWLNRKQNFGLVEIVWLVLMVAGLSTSSTHLFLWYIAPIYPVYLLFAGAAPLALADRWKLMSTYSRPTAAGIIVLAIVILVAANYRTVDYYRNYQSHLDAVHKSIGEYLHTHAKPNDVVAAEDIGYMGYYSGLTIVDRDGLVSPEVVPYNAKGMYLQMILDIDPDWVVVCPQSATAGFLDESLFAASYNLVKAFRGDQGSEYRVYSRVP